jgi:exo-1,4-beta-D-glucosaminidase
MKQTVLKKLDIIAILPFIIIVFAIGCANGSENQNKLILKDDWAIQSSAKVAASGKEISTVEYSTNSWYPTTAPVTVLKALVENKVYPDPYYGTNLLTIPGFRSEAWGILDMPEDSPFCVPWWYRTVFKLPANYRDKYTWLNLHSINYKANVWLNGHLIADTTTVEGAYRLFELNITDAAMPGKENCLALEIIPPVKGTDLSIRWMQGTQTPPDKDTGIWYDVKVIATGPVRMKHPHIITDLDLPSTKVAHIAISVDFVNISNESVKGVLQGQIENVNNLNEGGTSAGGDHVFKFSKEISLSAAENKTVTHKLDISNPNLWWPNLTGKQNLYDLKLRLIAANGELSDGEDVRFGIREVTSVVNSFDHGIRTRAFQINGKNIMVKGANYTENMMLEHSSEREEAEAKYIINMNLNALRTEGFWGTDHFYDLCDKYGIMIFDGTNCCSIWERWDHWTEHTFDIAGKSLRDQIIRKRNHPCFVDWLIGSDKSPPVDVERMYVDVIEKYDGTRPYQSNAYSDSTAICGYTGLSHDPYPATYAYLPPSTWYGKGELGKYEFLEFNTEVGPGGEQIPPTESMRKMMPAKDLWPISESWDLRLWRTQSPQGRAALYSRYGEPTELEEYTVKAQVLQKEAMRAMVEAFRKNKYKSSGILIYRLNAGWPSLCYHLYDYYLRPNGAFYGVQQACEPLHVQYSYDDSSVFVVNCLYQGFKNLKVSAKVVNFDMTEKYSNTVSMDMEPDGNKPAFVIPPIEGLSGNYFLKLTLESSSGELKSSNFYWLSTKGDQQADFKDLSKLPPVNLNTLAAYQEKGKNSIIRVKIENPTNDLAFFINLTVLKGLHGAEILPAFWSANYFSLLPKESRDLTVTFDSAILNGDAPHLMIQGWNIEPAEITLKTPNKVVTPAFEYINLAAPKSVRAGQEFKVSVTIKNSAASGDGLLKAQQYLYVDRQPTMYTRVALAPGEIKELIWSAIKLQQPGAHEIKVGTSAPVTVSVSR